MYRYTTETLVFELPIDTSDIVEAFITLYQSSTDTRLERSIDEMTKSGKELKVRLTQEETALFKAKNTCRVQLRVRDSLGNAYASRVFKIDVNDVMKEGVI